MFDSFIDWFMGLGEEYGVNPIIFGSIYIGAIPFFTASLGWFIRNLRKKKPVAVPALLSGFFFISAYLYLLIAGNNIPWWVYGVIVAMIAFGVYSTVQKVRAATKPAADSPSPATPSSAVNHLVTDQDQTHN